MARNCWFHSLPVSIFTCYDCVTNVQMLWMWKAWLTRKTCHIFKEKTFFFIINESMVCTLWHVFGVLKCTFLYIIVIVWLIKKWMRSALNWIIQKKRKAWLMNINKVMWLRLSRWGYQATSADQLICITNACPVPQFVMIECHNGKNNRLLSFPQFRFRII